MRFVSFVVTWLTDCVFRLFRVAYIPYARDYYGIGNRIKGLANFYARGYRRFLVLWNTENWVTERWDRLFELRDTQVCALYPGCACYAVLKFLLRRFMPVGIVREEAPFWSFILPPQLQRDEFRHHWHFAKVPSYSVDWWFNRVPNDVREYYRLFFEALKPAPEVCRKIGDQNYGVGLVGVQIRNTNLAADMKDVASLETMFRIMETFPCDRKFFVSCMTEEVSQKVHERFGDRVVELKNKDYKSMIDAVADMWILGQCAEMIVSPESTFSEVAWWWGGCRSQVTMVRAEYNQANVC